MANNYIYHRIIQSQRWRILCEEWKQKHPFCERCLKLGVKTPVREVHHIRPVGSARTIEEAEALAFDEDNLISLCLPCHVLAHKELKSHTAQTIRQRKNNQAEAALENLFGISEE